MSVSNGQIANAQTFNNAFMSRSVDTDTTGKIDLKNSGSSEILDVQAVVNENIVDIANAQTAITALENTRVFKAASSTDNAVPRFDGITGQTIQNSGVIVDDLDNVNIPGTLTVQGDLNVLGNNTVLNTQTVDAEDANITINKNGNDTTAQGAGITVDRTGVDGSIAYDSALNSRFKVGDLGSEREIATTSGTQTLTNKRYDGGTASATNVFIASKDTSANLAALPRIQGAYYYDTTLNRIVYDNGSVLTPVDGGASTAIDTTAGAVDSGKLIKTASDGFLNKTFNNTIPSFASESAFNTFLVRAPVVGDRFFDTTEQSLKIYNGTTYVVSSGSGDGVRNFITSGNADRASVSIFTPYSDAAAIRPVDGAGGAPTVTTSVTTVSPLDGTKSFLLSKPAGNLQGQGWSVDSFLLPLAYRAKVLKISVQYIVNSGTFTAGSNTTLGDVVWYIFDKTNNQLIEPSNVKMFSSSTTLSDVFEASFQSSATGADYRLIAHIAGTGTAPFELEVDSVTVSPENYVYGSPITDWQSFTPTWTSTGTQPVLGNGTLVGRYRKLGDSAQMQFQLTAGSTTTFGTGFYAFGFAAVGSADLQKTLQGLSGQSLMHRGSYFDASPGSIYDLAGVFGATQVGLRAMVASGTYVQHADVTPTIPVTMAAGDQIYFEMTLPMSGWSSSVQVSDGFQSRNINAHITRVGNQTGVNPNNSYVKVFLNNVVSDDVAGFDVPNSRYIIQSSGDYVFNAAVSTLTTNVISGYHGLAIYRNGLKLQDVSFISNSANVFVWVSGATTPVKLNAGDIIELYFRGLQNNSVSTLTIDTSFLGVSKIQGPSTIAPTETVAVKYANNAGTSFANNLSTVIPFPTRIEDTHNCFNGTTGTFTAPSSGLYQISASVQLIVPIGTGLDIVLLGPGLRSTRIAYTAAGNQHGVLMSGIVRLLSGQTYQVSIVQLTGATRSLETGSLDLNTISIHRIGL